MEQKRVYSVFYNNIHVKVVAAHTKWEAEDRVYGEMVQDYPHVERVKFNAIEVRNYKFVR